MKHPRLQSALPLLVFTFFADVVGSAAGEIAATPRARGPATLYDHVFDVVLTADAGAAPPAAHWRDSVVATTWRGRDALRREQANTRPGKTEYVGWTTNIFDPVTFLPYSSERKRKDGLFVRWEFDGLKVTETKTVLDLNSAPPTPPSTKLETSTRTFTLPEPVYDYFGGLYGALFSGMPLQAGLDGSFPALAFAGSAPTIVRVHYRVSGPEKVTADDGTKVDAWKIETDADDQNPVYSYWVTVQSPRIQRVAYRQGAGLLTFAAPEKSAP